MKKLFIIAAALVLAACSHKGQEPMSVRMVRSEMARCQDAKWLDFKEGQLSWNYTPGIELRAFLDVYRTYGGEDIYEYAERWYDEIISADGRISGYKLSSYNVDKVCPGKNLFYLYERTGKAKYAAAADTLYSQLQSHPRTSEGGLWHKAIYPHQIWLDGLYMAPPFYVEYAASRLDADSRQEAFGDIVNDFLVAAKHTYDPSTGLYRHAWDESRSMFWCDPVSGQSQHCWARGLGWYVMGIEEVLDWLPQETMAAERQSLVDILRGIFDTLPRYADPATGLWYQVLDQPGREGNYLEATACCMFSYALLKGVRLGYLDAGLRQYATDTYNAVVRQFVSEDADGLLSLNDCCAVGGLGGKQMRMGDYDYYLSEPVRSNDPKGIGPFIWASLEMERL